MPINVLRNDTPPLPYMGVWVLTPYPHILPPHVCFCDLSVITADRDIGGSPGGSPSNVTPAR